MDSIHSFLTNHDQTINNATRKDIVIVETHSSFPEKSKLFYLVKANALPFRTEEKSQVSRSKRSKINVRLKKTHWETKKQKTLRIFHQRA